MHNYAGGGLYHTEAQPLNLLRRNIDKNSRQIKSILAGGELAKEFFGVQAGGNKQKAVQAFVERNKEDALKTAPKVSFFMNSVTRWLSFKPFLLLCPFFLYFFSLSLRLSGFRSIRDLRCIRFVISLLTTKFSRK